MRRCDDTCDTPSGASRWAGWPLGCVPLAAPRLRYGYQGHAFDRSAVAAVARRTSAVGCIQGQRDSGQSRSDRNLSSITRNLGDIDTVCSGGGDLNAYYLGIEMILSRVAERKTGVVRQFLCSNSRWPPKAATWQVSWSHGQPFALNHFRISPRPPRAACMIAGRRVPRTARAPGHA